MTAFRFAVDGLQEAILFGEAHSGSVGSCRLTEDAATEISLCDGSDALW